VDLRASLVIAVLAADSAAPKLAPVDPEGRSYPYPFSVHSFSFRSQRQALQMAYLDEQPAQGNGKAVLLLHGKNFSAAYWAPTIAALKDAGFRTIAPDQIGFGKSSKPDHYQFSFATLADNTRALLDSLGVRTVTVVGHSMGGVLAVRFARLFPDRTEKLALVNPLGLEDYAQYLGARPVDAWYQAELRQTPEKIREYQRRNYYGGAWKPEYEELIRMQAGFTLHPDYPRVAWNSALIYDMILTQPVVHELDQIRVPTLLLIGARDRTAVGRDLVAPEVASRMGDIPSLARQAARRIGGARLVEIPGAGHLPQVEAFPRYREALLTFLGR
jgi:pimeloyl-ACP methyl ester carboxylesterase